MLDLMARGGLRVGEVLKIGPVDIRDRKTTLAGPTSGKEPEVVFIPQKAADDPGVEKQPSGRPPPVKWPADFTGPARRAAFWKAYQNSKTEMIAKLLNLPTRRMVSPGH